MTVFVDISPGKGLGLFASKNFAKGEIIENCPIVIIPKEDIDKINSTILYEYVFEWGDDLAVCLGYGSLINHAPEPNAEFDLDKEQKRIVFKTLRDIKKGEEIFIDYGWDLEEKTPHWFKKLHRHP